jgi:hypothetical protein
MQENPVILRVQDNDCGDEAIGLPYQSHKLASLIRDEGSIPSSASLYL